MIQRDADLYEKSQKSKEVKQETENEIKKLIEVNNAIFEGCTCLPYMLQYTPKEMRQEICQRLNRDMRNACAKIESAISLWHSMGIHVGTCRLTARRPSSPLLRLAYCRRFSFFRGRPLCRLVRRTIHGRWTARGRRHPPRAHAGRSTGYGGSVPH